MKKNNFLHDKSKKMIQKIQEEIIAEICTDYFKNI